MIFAETVKVWIALCASIPQWKMVRQGKSLSNHEQWVKKHYMRKCCAIECQSWIYMNKVWIEVSTRTHGHFEFHVSFYFKDKSTWIQINIRHHRLDYHKLQQISVCFYLLEAWSRYFFSTFFGIWRLPKIAQQSLQLLVALRKSHARVVMTLKDAICLTHACHGLVDKTYR